MGVPRADALQATAAVCRALGLPESGLRVIRSSTYVAIRIGGTPYVARVGRTADTHAGHRREMAIARALAAHGAPVALPAPLDDPLLVHRDCSVGFWLWIDERLGSGPTMADLGAVLRRVHDAGALTDLDGLDLPAFTAPGQARSRIRRLLRHGHVDEATAGQLTALVDALAPAPRPTDGLVHGDFRAANVLASADGPVVIDFDAASLAPLAWDLTLVAQQHRRFGLPAAGFEAFLAAYGAAGAARFDDLCRLRDVTSTIWALTTAATLAPDFAPEAGRRLASVQDPDDRSPWSWTGLPSARPTS